MKRFFTIIIIGILCLGLVACGESHDGQAKTPSGSSVLKGRDYEKVVKTFEDAGFTNVKTEKITDLVTGILTKDGEVEEVSVGGDANYSSDKWVSTDTEVIIKYHTFKDSSTDETSEEKSTEASKDTTDSTVLYYNDTSDITKDTERRQAAMAIADKQPDVVLNKDNNTELSELLELSDSGNSKISEFSLNYYGWTIEFDGCVNAVDNYKNFENHYDVLIGTGDYDANHTKGPSFKIENMDGNKYTDASVLGTNIHIVAKVGAYDANTQLFPLMIVSVTAR